MIFSGYRWDGRPSERSIRLKEVALGLTDRELNSLISFLTSVRDDFAKVKVLHQAAHSHYRDWNKRWEEGEDPDLVICHALDKDAMDPTRTEKEKRTMSSASTTAPRRTKRRNARGSTA